MMVGVVQTQYLQYWTEVKKIVFMQNGRVRQQNQLEIFSQKNYQFYTVKYHLGFNQNLTLL